MKKILACMSLVFALSAGATALADELDTSPAYDSSENSLTVRLSGATKMNTVLITKDNDTGNDGIVFVDQNDDTFSSVSKFLLKGNSLAPGTYTVKMNNDLGTGYEKKTFTVAEGALDRVDVSIQAFKYAYFNNHTNQDEYDAGFKVENADLSNVHYIAITNVTENKTAYIELDGTYATNANVAIRINNIPENVTVSVALTATKPNDTSN